MKHSALSSLFAKKSNGFYLAIFFIFFAITIIFSLVLKGINVYKNASFTGDSIMLLVVTNRDSYIMRLDKKNEQLSLLKIYDAEIDTNNLTRASIRTGVPLHGAFKITDPNADIRDIVTVKGVVQLILRNDIKLIHLNELDALRIAYAAQKITTENTTVREIKNYVNDRSIISQIDTELYELFRDPQIINERISIEVMNATTTSGLATAVAHMLENGGYTVVAIRSSDIQKNSSIQTQLTDPVTVQDIKKIFRFPETSLPKNAVADIRIIIGEDAIE